LFGCRVFSEQTSTQDVVSHLSEAPTYHVILYISGYLEVVSRRNLDFRHFDFAPGLLSLITMYYWLILAIFINNEINSFMYDINTHRLVKVYYIFFRNLSRMKYLIVLAAVLVAVQSQPWEPSGMLYFILWEVSTLSRLAILGTLTTN